MKKIVIAQPDRGSWITVASDGTLELPNDPIIGFIEGDGVGPDIWAASRPVFEAAVAKGYHGERSISWWEIPAGEKSFEKYGNHLPKESLQAVEKAHVVIKGPLTTPVGGGFRSLNVTLRQKLNLYACVRPVRHIAGTPSPMRRPQDVNMVVFRENTEDVYAGLEWKSDSDEARQIITFLKETLGVAVDPASGIGLKPMSPAASKKLVRKALQYALDHGRKRVTLVHKGNIMKFTEGAFRDWGYEVARDEFRDKVVFDDELPPGGEIPRGKVLVNDMIADAMFQFALLRPSEFEVLALPNLNGDYISDALAAQVGGLGMAPGSNIGDRCAIFEATHGTAPKYAGMDKVNPGSLILSGALMFDYMGWNAAADLILKAISDTIKSGTVTYDLARQMKGAEEVSCSAFGAAMVERIEAS